MKHLLSLILIICISGITMAQTAGELRIGAGLAIGTEAGLDDNGTRAMGLGFNLGGEYFVVEKISVAPSFTYFFKSSVGSPPAEFSLSLNTVNIDGKYYFLDAPVEVYGIAGISIASATAESNVNFLGVNSVSKSSESEVGINFGAGTNLRITDELQGNIQLIYNTPLEQPIFNLGVTYRIM